MLRRCVLAYLLATTATAAETLEITAHVGNGTGDNPMIVAWVVKAADGSFVRTLHWFSKDKKYYPDLDTWAKGRQGKEGKDPLDAVMGPTIAWSTTRSAEVPIHLGGLDLLDGTYVLRIEQCKDKGGHFRSIKIPLTADFTTATVDADKIRGYLSKLVVTAK